MSAPRPHSLLVLLVVVPLALLAWLGVSLHRDSEGRLREATSGIIKERLQIAESHLLEALRDLVTELDSQSSEAVLASVDAEDRTSLVKTARIEEAVGAQSAPQKAMLEGGGQRVTRIDDWQIRNERPDPQGNASRAVQTFLMAEAGGGWSILAGRNESAKNSPTSGLLTRFLGSRDKEMIYWRYEVKEGRLLIAQLRVDELMSALSNRVPPPWLTTGQGSLLLLTEHKQVLRHWGSSDFELAAAEEFTLACSPPLAGVRISYVPGPDEFPAATLFPILLGATSGSLLVPSLAWLFFRENRRELQLAQQRVSFVNQVSHELKTPLTNIRLYAEMVRSRAEEADDKVSVRQLTVVETETARLSRLIQNVLNFARKQRERLSIQPRPICLTGLIDNLTIQWRPILEKRGITLQLDQPHQIEMVADPDALEQIVGNLFSNIEKYAAEGCFVQMAVVDETKRVVVSVGDQGPGIPPGKQEFIFEPFERLRSDLREGVSGTGIGLTISRELARLHGGDLIVDPGYTQGARFILTLPLKPAHEVANSALSA